MFFRPAAHPVHLNLAYQVLHYIETRLGQPFTIRDISEEVGVSYFYLHHLFGQTAGENLGQLIRRVNLEHAFGYVKHSGYTMGDIGDLTGFGSKHSFSRAFSQYFNQSPTKIRSQRHLIVPGSFVQQDRLSTVYDQQWKQQMLDNQYVIRQHPSTPYFFHYLGPMATGSPEAFGQRLGRLFEIQALLKLPLAFGTSGIGCATSPAKAIIRAGFLVQDERQTPYLKQCGFFRHQLEAGNFLMARFNGALPSGGMLTYSVIQQSVQEGLFHLRDHHSLVLIEPAKPDQFEVMIPVA
ncbi:helix-turn-helix transcriptional regulator [Larkinella sp. GY13]|uniref:helix-turn-helix transcriptional regulator n=1 Tax=Larkinella sp. GY13 TaxID=3453720 RepID=UPI003EEE2EB1